MTVLQSATREQLLEAIAANHRVLFRMEARMAGGEERHTGSIVWTSPGAGKGSNIVFPRLSEEEAVPVLEQLLDALRLSLPRQADCWSMDPSQPADLGVLLLARGFHTGWRPHWMMLDLQEDLGAAAPTGLEVVADQTSDLGGIEQLPYAKSTTLTQDGRAEGALTQRFVARLGGKIVGHSGVLCTQGDLGVAGLYNVGVQPQYRGRGIGKALVLATCRFARDHGWRYAVLNATYDGRRIYTQVGFRSLGEGLTWGLVIERWLRTPPTPQQIALAEAIGRGDTRRLEGMDFSLDALNQPLSNGMTLMELAVHLRQPLSAEWLIANGVPLRPLEAWDLGWKDRFSALLSERPALVNDTYGEGELTLLHTAVEREDEELLRLTLVAGPDREIRDKNYQSTALGWAHHFGHRNMVRLLQ
jgi:predicted N-acetyltransferase YhbS